jgi:hypothetical protein
MTPKSILKKLKFAAKDTPTDGETQEGEEDQINLARMSLAAPTNATTTITTGTQPGEGTSDQQEGKDEGTAFQIRKPSGDYYMYGSGKKGRSSRNQQRAREYRQVREVTQLVIPQISIRGTRTNPTLTYNKVVNKIPRRHNAA